MNIESVLAPKNETTSVLFEMPSKSVEKKPTEATGEVNPEPAAPASASSASATTFESFRIQYAEFYKLHETYFDHFMMLVQFLGCILFVSALADQSYVYKKRLALSKHLLNEKVGTIEKEGYKRQWYEVNNPHGTLDLFYCHLFGVAVFVFCAVLYKYKLFQKATFAFLIVAGVAFILFQRDMKVLENNTMLHATPSTAYLPWAWDYIGRLLLKS